MCWRCCDKYERKIFRLIFPYIDLFVTVCAVKLAVRDLKSCYHKIEDTPTSHLRSSHSWQPFFLPFFLPSWQPAHANFTPSSISVQKHWIPQKSEIFVNFWEFWPLLYCGFKCAASILTVWSRFDRWRSLCKKLLNDSLCVFHRWEEPSSATYKPRTYCSSTTQRFSNT